MEFHVARNAFLTLLSRVQTIVERRHTIPILGNVLLVVEEDRVMVSATDGEVSLRTFCSVESSHPGAITVSARTLFEIIRELPDTMIRLVKKDQDRLLITCGRARFSLAGLSADLFPDFSDVDTPFRCLLPSDVFSDLLEKTHFAMSHDEDRFTINGILLQILQRSHGDSLESIIRFVATDSHRLVMAEYPIELSHEEKREVILPRKAVMEARKILGENDQPVEIRIGDNQIQFLRSETVLISKLVDGEFPPYIDIIPKNNQQFLTLNRQMIQTVVRRVSILSHEKSRGIRFEITQNHLKVIARNPNSNEDAEEELDAVYDGEPISIALNARYFQEMLNVLRGESIRLALGIPETPFLMTDPEEDSTLFVLMPMRI